MFREYSFIPMMMFYFIVVYPTFLVSEEKNNLKINSIDAQFIESIDQDTLKLNGDVIIKADNIELWSDEAVYDRKNQLISLKGNIKALSKNLSIKAESMEADFQKNKFLLNNSSFNFIDRGFGKAQLVNIQFTEDIELLNVSISSCNNENLSWDLEAEKIIILEDRKNVIVRDVSVKLNDVPFFYVPYLRSGVGNESFSGFLSPSIKQGKDGLDLTIPYFFSFAPNYDLTLAPRYIQERGSGLDAEGRFLSKNSKGTLALSHFSKDRKFSKQSSESDKRWAAMLHGIHRGNSPLHFEILSEHVSDDLYFEDLSDDILGTQQKDFLTRNLSVGINLNDVKFKGEINQFQNLNPFSSNDYETRPNFNVDYQKKLEHARIRIITDYTKFSFDKDFNPLDKKKDIKRIFIEPSLRMDSENSWSKSSITAGIRKTDYETHINKFDNSYHWAEFSHKLFYDKVSKNRFSTLSPMMKLIWIDGENEFKNSVDSKILNLNYDNLFRKNWYTGSDLFLEENRIVLGIEYNSYGLYTKKERSFSLGRAFFKNKEKSNVTSSKNSSYVSDFKFNLVGDFKLSGSFELSSNLKKLRRGHFGIIYEKDERRNLQLRSLYKRKVRYLNNPVIWKDFEKPINQIELISQWTVADSFLLFGKISRDQEINYTRDLSYGFEYYNCCLKVGLMKRKWLDQDYYSFYDSQLNPSNILDAGLLPEREKDNIYIFFELSELGRFGKRISDVLRSKRFQ